MIEMCTYKSLSIKKVMIISKYLDVIVIWC